MPSPIKLKPHLTTDDLYQRYRKCQQAREKIRWRALYLIAKGGIANQVAKRVGRSSGWMTNLARRYNKLGATGVSDQRPKPLPIPPTLNSKQALALEAALRGPAPDGGLWTSPKVAAWIKKKPAKKFILRLLGGRCGGLALRFKCRARAIAMLPLKKSKPRLKKARPRRWQSESSAPRRRSRELVQL